MRILMFIILAIALIYSLVRMKKGARWAKPVIVIIILITLPTALISMVSRMRRPIPRPEYKVEEVRGRELARAFSEYLPSHGKVLIFSRDIIDETSPNPHHDNLMKGLKSGFSKKRISVTKVIGLPNLGFPPDGEIPEEYKKQVLTFYNESLSKNSGIDGWISFGMVPENLKGLDIFSLSNPPKVALGGESMSRQLSALMQEGYIHTIVSASPDPGAWIIKEGEKFSPEVLFQKRYIVVTPHNLAQIIKKYPKFDPSIE